MTHRARTNQLLYQAELLLMTAPRARHDEEDEVTDARRQALREGALAMLELALASLLREVTEHAGLEHCHWQELLGDVSLSCAELVRLRELADQPSSWLSWLLAGLEELHSPQGRRCRKIQTGRIAVVEIGASSEDGLWTCLSGIKNEIEGLRETGQEW